MDHHHFLARLFEPASVVLILGAHAPVWALEMARQFAADEPARRVLRLDAVKPDNSAPDGSPDQLAIVAVAPDEAPEAIALAARRGARAVSLMTDPHDASQALAWREQAQRLGLRLLGPGSMGFVRPSLRLNAGRMGPLPASGQVALVSQSGVLNGAVLDWVADSAVGFSLVVSLGAEVDVDLAQVLDYLASDAQTRSVVVYLEAVRDSRSFMSALRALAAVKPVIVLKGQRDDRSPRHALTHSGALCGSDAIYSAALRRAGALQIRLFTQMFTAARILASTSGPLGQRLGVLANGNGPGVLAADQAGFQHLTLPALSEATRDALAQVLPGRAIANPLNLGAGASADDFGAALTAMAADRDLDGVLVMLAPSTGVDGEAITRRVIEVIGTLHKPVFACWMGDRGMRPLARQIDAAGIPVYSVPEAAVDAYATVANFHQNQRLLQQTPRALSGTAQPHLEGARLLIDSVLAEGRQVLSEMESKALLGAFHVPVTRTMLARSQTEAIVIAEQIGFPVVMKIHSADVTHKSDVGGVVLNVRNAAEVRSQYLEIQDAVQRALPQARLDGVTLQNMRRGRHGRELYVGVFRDPLFGPVIAFGAGGTRVEVVDDTTLEFPPLNRYLARRMIERTRIAETLGEFRGAPAIDFERLEALLVAVSEMVCELPWIAEMDINPVIVDEGGLVAVDARVVLDPTVGPRPARHAHMAIMPYPAHLTRVLAAPDGGFYTLRPIQSEDADRLQTFMKNLSAESRYFRFISVLSELPPRMLVRYTQIDYDRELALVAVVGGPAGHSDVAGGSAADAAGGSDNTERIVGVVRYLLNVDRESCEFAVAIADDWQGKRLGSTMMRAIIEAARTKGLRRIEGYVLSTNARMLGLMIHLGFTVKTDPQDATMKLVWMEFTPGDSSSPAPPLRATP
jgi:acetyltransferase